MNDENTSQKKDNMLDIADDFYLLWRRVWCQYIGLNTAWLMMEGNYPTDLGLTQYEIFTFLQVQIDGLGDLVRDMKDMCNRLNGVEE